MEDRWMKYKMRKRDGIFLGILFLVAFLFFMWFLLGYHESGKYVEVTIDGEWYGTYALNETQEIPIWINGNRTNLLVIKDKKADVLQADCPDKICVNHSAISNVGETIVCLPNRVVIAVIGNGESQMDSMVQ